MENKNTFMGILGLYIITWTAISTGGYLLKHIADTKNKIKWKRES